MQLVGATNSEFSYSQAKKLCACIEEYLQQIEQKEEDNKDLIVTMPTIDWKKISQSMREKEESMSPVECHRLWKYAAYGLNTTDFVDSDEEDCYTKPKDAFERYNAAEFHKKHSRDGDSISSLNDTSALLPNFHSSMLQSKFLIPSAVYNGNGSTLPHVYSTTFDYSGESIQAIENPAITPIIHYHAQKSFFPLEMIKKEPRMNVNAGSSHQYQGNNLPPRHLPQHHPLTPTVQNHHPLTYPNNSTGMMRPPLPPYLQPHTVSGPPIPPPNQHPHPPKTKKPKTTVPSMTDNINSILQMNQPGNSKGPTTASPTVSAPSSSSAAAPAAAVSYATTAVGAAVSGGGGGTTTTKINVQQLRGITIGGMPLSDLTMTKLTPNPQFALAGNLLPPPHKATHGAAPNTHTNIRPARPPPSIPTHTAVTTAPAPVGGAPVVSSSSSSSRAMYPLPQSQYRQAQAVQAGHVSMQYPPQQSAPQQRPQPPLPLLQPQSQPQLPVEGMSQLQSTVMTSSGNGTNMTSMHSNGNGIGGNGNGNGIGSSGSGGNGSGNGVGTTGGGYSVAATIPPLSVGTLKALANFQSSLVAKGYGNTNTNTTTVSTTAPPATSTESTESVSTSQPTSTSPPSTE